MKDVLDKHNALAHIVTLVLFEAAWGSSMQKIDKSARRFERPVIVRTEKGDRLVVDVNSAADVLLKAFPRETARRKAAMAACLGVLRGQAHPLVARRAFVSAALEVGILASD